MIEGTKALVDVDADVSNMLVSMTYPPSSAHWDDVLEVITVNPGGNKNGKTERVKRAVVLKNENFADRLSDFALVVKDQFREWPEACASLLKSLERHGAQLKTDPNSGEVIKADRSEWHYIGDEDE